jgi:hypothetical protein
MLVAINEWRATYLAPSVRTFFASSVKKVVDAQSSMHVDGANLPHIATWWSCLVTI